MSTTTSAVWNMTTMKMEENGPSNGLSTTTSDVWNMTTMTMDHPMKELIRVTDSYKCAIKGTGTANPSEVHEIIQLYIYNIYIRLKIKPNSVRIRF